MSLTLKFSLFKIKNVNFITRDLKKKNFFKKIAILPDVFLWFVKFFLIYVNEIMFFLGHMCNRPLGMMTGAIKNSAITASSMWDKHHAPFLARLNARRMGRYQSAWSAR